MYIETEQLILRDMKAEDIPFLVALWTDPQVTKFMGGPRDAASLEKGFHEDLNNPNLGKDDLWPVFEKVSGKPVGHCGLLEKEVDGQLEVELVYTIHPSAWGNGYASEIARGLVQYAWRELGLTRLISMIEPDNEASERVALNAGLMLERETIRPGNRLLRVYAIQRPTEDEA